MFTFQDTDGAKLLDCGSPSAALDIRGKDSRSIQDLITRLVLE